MAEQARIVLFPGIPWVQTVQRCLHRVFRGVQSLFSALTEAGMGVLEGGKRSPHMGLLESLCLGFHFTYQGISAVAEILAFLNGSHALHTVNQREVSLLCL